MAAIERVKTLTGAGIHVVVVDNASSDGSPDAIRDQHPDVTVLVEVTNRGFAGGVNRGLEEAARLGADYAWLLNDDTCFEPNVLVPMLAYAEAHPEVGLLSPIIRDLDEPANIQFGNGSIDWSQAVMRHNVPFDVEASLVASGATRIAPGTALLCDMRVYRAIGPFEPRYFAYWEDVDYAVRAAQAGWSCGIVESAMIGHAASEPHERPPHYHYYMVRNEALFFRLHGGPSRRWIRRWLGTALKRIADSRDRGKSDQASALIDGLWDAAVGRYGPRSARTPAPRAVRRILLTAPYTWATLVDGDLGRILRRFRH